VVSLPPENIDGLDVTVAKTSRSTSYRRPQCLAPLPKSGVSGQILCRCLETIPPAHSNNRDPRTLPLVTGGATVYGDGVLASTDNVAFCQLAPFQVSKVMGAMSSLSVTNHGSGNRDKSALISMGSLVYAQFGQKVPAGEVGKTYTYAARVTALGGPVVVRLEVERAGRPWDRAARGQDLSINPGDRAELHLTFAVDKAYPEGWQAYLNSAGEGSRF
jgi:hypothetical protein